MVALLGGTIGYWPAFIALLIYSILPIVRNTIVGLESVDPAMREAAKAVGMRPLQQLFRVELPLAFPVILAGIRTATVWVVGIATLLQHLLVPESWQLHIQWLATSGLATSDFWMCCDNDAVACSGPTYSGY